MATNGIEAAIVNFFAHKTRQLRLAAFWRIEAAFPMPEGLIPIGHRRKPHMCNVIEQGYRRIQ